MATTRNDRSRPARPATIAFIAAAAATAVAGAVLAFGLQPTTDISEDMWRYPWSSSGAFVAFSILSAVLHSLVIVGLVAFGRSGAAGRSRAARTGVTLAVTGTALLLVGEVVSIPVRNLRSDDNAALPVIVIFAVAAFLSAIGFLLAGRATRRAGVWQGWRRNTPLATGLWLVVLNVAPPIAPTVLHGAVGIYGLCLLAMAIALHTAPATAMAGTTRDVQLQRA